jgi:hypothetical protein
MKAASGSAAADLRDQDDLALGFELSEIGVREDLAVDGRCYSSKSRADN